MKVTDITIDDLNYADEHFFDDDNDNNKSNPSKTADEDHAVSVLIEQSELNYHIAQGVEVLSSCRMDIDMIAHAMVATGIRVGLLMVARRVMTDEKVA